MSESYTQGVAGPESRIAPEIFRKLVLRIHRQIDHHEELLQAVVEGACTLTGARQAFLFIAAREPRAFRLAAQTDTEGHPDECLSEAAIRTSIVTAAAAADAAVTWNDIRAASGHGALHPDHAAELAVPLVVNHRAAAVLVVAGRQPGAFHAHHAEWLGWYAEQAALALENGRRLAAERAAGSTWRDVFQSVREGILLCGEDLAIRHVNHGFLKLVGRTERHVLSLAADEAFYRFSIFGSQTRFWKLLRRCGRFEQKCRTPSGRRSFHISASRATLDQQPGFLIVVRETTHQDELQERVAQAEKAASFGQVMARLAHELNNPVQTVLGLSEWLALRPDSSGLAGLLHTIHAESRRTARLVKSLLVHARLRPVELTAVSANRLVEEAVRGWESTGNAPHPPVELRLLTRDTTVKGDVFQLGQLLTHLLDHLHQLPRCESNGTPRALCVTLAGLRAGVRVSLSTRPPRDGAARAANILDAGRNARGPRAAVALDLSSCQHIVQQHHGRIWRESDASGGTAFHVELPDGGEAPVRAAANPAVAIRPGARVLVIDDEPAIGELLEHVLQSRKLAVEVAAGADEALACIARQDYDLILCDLNMPGRDGRAFYQATLESRPELARRVIFFTGDVLSRYPDLFPDDHPHEVLFKPLDLGQLLDRVTRRLARTEAVA